MFPHRDLPLRREVDHALEQVDRVLLAAAALREALLARRQDLGGAPFLLSTPLALVRFYKFATSLLHHDYRQERAEDDDSGAFATSTRRVFGSVR